MTSNANAAQPGVRPRPIGHWVLMSSILASGINSSLSRLAGVLSIAVLGPVVLASFDHSLEARASRLNLSAEAGGQLKRESAKLAEAHVPSGLSAETSIAVKQAIQWAFVDAFRWVAGLAAGLSWLGALLAAWLLAGRESSRGSPLASVSRIDSRNVRGNFID